MPEEVCTYITLTAHCHLTIFLFHRTLPLYLQYSLHDYPEWKNWMQSDETAEAHTCSRTNPPLIWIWITHSHCSHTNWYMHTFVHMVPNPNILSMNNVCWSHCSPRVNTWVNGGIEREESAHPFANVKIWFCFKNIPQLQLLGGDALRQLLWSCPLYSPFVLLFLLSHFSFHPHYHVLRLPSPTYSLSLPDFCLGSWFVHHLFKP